MESELKEKLDSTIFIGMDISSQVSNLIKARESVITKGMFPGELKAYKLGVDNCVSLLKQLLETDCEDEFVIQIEKMGDKQEEFVFADLLNINREML